eukprot:2494153-Amphidinium_carterae.1
MWGSAQHDLNTIESCLGFCGDTLSSCRTQQAAAPSSLALASSSTALVPSSDRGCILVERVAGSNLGAPIFQKSSASAAPGSVGLKTSGGDLKSMLLSTGYKAPHNVAFSSKLHPGTSLDL